MSYRLCREQPHGESYEKAMRNEDKKRPLRDTAEVSFAIVPSSGSSESSRKITSAEVANKLPQICLCVHYICICYIYVCVFLGKILQDDGRCE